MAFFSEAKGSGGLPSPSLSSSKRKRGSSGSSRNASLKLAALLVVVAASSFFLGRNSSSTTTTTTTKTSTSAPLLVPSSSGSAEEFKITVVTLSLRPRVFFLPGFADPALAEALADATEPKLSPSTLALRPGERAEDKAGIRTSDGVFVSAAEDPSGFLAAVERRAEALTGVPRSHGEAFNVLRYGPGGRYETHHDYFDDAEYGPQASQRVATLLVYLRTPPAGSGGETCFEAAGRGRGRGARARGPRLQGLLRAAGAADAAWGCVALLQLAPERHDRQAEHARGMRGVGGIEVGRDQVDPEREDLKR